MAGRLLAYVGCLLLAAASPAAHALELVAGQAPPVTVISLPFLFRNVLHMLKVIDGLLVRDVATKIQKVH